MIVEDYYQDQVKILNFLVQYLLVLIKLIIKMNSLKNFYLKKIKTFYFLPHLKVVIELNKFILVLKILQQIVI